MMKFDGEARFRRDRVQRSRGYLRREGFHPARRHPSAARHRYQQRAHTDDELNDELYGKTASATLCPALGHSSLVVRGQGACGARAATSTLLGCSDRTARSASMAYVGSAATRSWASPKLTATAASLRLQCAPPGQSFPTAAPSRCAVPRSLALTFGKCAGTLTIWPYFVEDKFFHK